MARIDIVVFPNGGREIFGQVNSAGYEYVSACIDGFLAGLEPSYKPRKFTGYYDEPDASDIEWQPYDENNPIVQIPVERDLTETEIEAPDTPEIMETVSMELAQVPMEMRNKVINQINMSD